MASRLYGEPISAAALTAGLPLEDGRLSPAIVERAAARGGLRAQLASMPLQDIRTELLPAILPLTDGTACLMIERDGDRARVLLPEAPDSAREIALSELEAGYDGTAIMLK